MSVVISYEYQGRRVYMPANEKMVEPPTTDIQRARVFTETEAADTVLGMAQNVGPRLTNKHGVVSEAWTHELLKSVQLERINIYDCSRCNGRGFELRKVQVTPKPVNPDE